MVTINLKKHYPHIRDDTFVNVSDEVYEGILQSIRQENNYNSRRCYHKAYYSLNCDDGIENEVLKRVASAEEVFLQNLAVNQLYEALRALSKKQFRRVYKRYILKQKAVEIAKQEGVTDKSIHQAILRGVRNMKKYYESEKK